MSKEKFNRLTRRTHFTDEEKAAFISRQLVETRQGTKAITQILSQVFPDSEIIFSKAGNVSDFRNKYKFYKVRCVNDFHHANDAYLNIVVGNTYFVKFTINPINFIREAKKYPNREAYKYNMDKIFNRNVERNGEIAWVASTKENSETGTITTVRKVMGKNSPLVTKMCKENHGGITRKATIWNADTAKGEGYIPVKQNDLSAFNREITANGYLTQIGLFHDNMFNPFNFASDLMEPFRILVDNKVYHMQPKIFEHKEKMELVNILNHEVIINERKEYVGNAIKIYCRSVFDAIESSDISEIRFYRNEL